jgi:hypothetical protein
LEFKNFYWLKEDLINFCKNNSIPYSGSKKDLTERICHFLKTGRILKQPVKSARTKTKYRIDITLNSRIPGNYRNDELHRTFFKKVIGKHFKFNVQFMNWVKDNSGKTYRDAINEWNHIYNEKKSGRKYEISPQFEYNQYMRDFFSANPDLSREQAIQCWKYKKSLPGSNKYEKKDLDTLKNI